MLKVGTLLDGKYEIIRQIGKGGTSLVYLSMNPKLNQQWVIKEIRSELSATEKNRMLQEARLMMTFDHPAIPRIVDILDDTYIVMDYVSGQSLAHELKENGPVDQDTVIEWAKQICNVLVYLHSLDPPVIYHDLKPGNVILKLPERTLMLRDICAAVEGESITQAASIALQEQILQQAQQVEENISREYENLKRGEANG